MDVDGYLMSRNANVLKVVCSLRTVKGEAIAPILVEQKNTESNTTAHSAVLQRACIIRNVSYNKRIQGTVPLLCYGRGKSPSLPKHYHQPKFVCVR